MLRILVLCVSAVVLLPVSARGEGYGLADLQALEKQGSWRELVEHLEDLPPSKRDAAWAKLAENGASGLIAEEKVDEKNASYRLSLIQALMKRYPSLKQSKVFMQKRSEIGIEALSNTFNNYSHSMSDEKWVPIVKEFVEADTLTKDIAERAAKMIQQPLAAYVAWPLWKVAIDRGGSPCADADFQEAIVMTAEQSSYMDETPAAFTKCWSTLKAPLVKKLAATTDRQATKSFCTVLTANGETNAKCTAKK